MEAEEVREREKRLGLPLLEGGPACPGQILGFKVWRSW
jgi:hypothetical protein